MTKERGLTESQRSTLADCLRDGLSLRAAAARAGVAASTVGEFYKAHRPPHPDPPPDTPESPPPMTTLAEPPTETAPAADKAARWDQLKGEVFAGLRDFAAVSALIDAIPRAQALNFWNVGRALEAIRDEEAYKPHYATFKDCVREEFGLEPAQANREMAAFRTLRALPPGSPAPTAESQLRPIASLPADTQQQVWAAAAASAGGGTPTAAQVRAAKAGVVGPRPAPGSAAEAKARGVIPADAEVTTEEAAPSSLPAAPEVEPELTEAEWLLTLPARGKIPEGTRRAKFDADALFYRRTEAFRDAYRRACTAEGKVADRETGGDRPHFVAKHYGFCKTESPEFWPACGDCGGSCVTTFGDCPTCRGRGYHAK